MRWKTNESEERGSRRANPIDVHVGSRVRLRRMLLGMSQEKLGEHLGLTFQQIQKYEKGVNRIGASRLFDLSQVLAVPVQFFYEELPVSRRRRRGPGSPSARPKATPSSSSAAAKGWSSTRRSLASPIRACAAPSSSWCAPSPAKPRPSPTRRPCHPSRRLPRSTAGLGCRRAALGVRRDGLDPVRKA